MQEGGTNVAGSWPEAFSELTSELRADRGRPALIDCSSPSAKRLIEVLSPLVDDVVSLGRRIGEMEEVPTATQLVDGLTSAVTLLLDIDVLFAPALQLEVASQLRRTSQRTALIVAWPGQIAGGRLSYSLPGRADHVDEPARDLVVLRPVDAEFPDEIPYTVERYLE
jgi:hypothetical protein